MAVGYHFFNDFDTAPTMMAEIRKTYDGPVELAQDYMVFNVTKQDIRVRMSAINEDVWPSPAQRPKVPAQGAPPTPSKFISDGRVLYPWTLRTVWKDVNKEFGTDLNPRTVAKELMQGADDEKDEEKDKK